MASTRYYTPDSDAGVYRARWLKALDDCEILNKRLDKWREAACSAIAVAIALVAALVLEAYAKKC